MLDALKPILASRTVWSNAVGFLALALGALGVPSEALGDTGKITESAMQVVAGASFLASTAFRILAVKRLV
jgi:hypothetical protein